MMKHKGKKNAATRSPSASTAVSLFKDVLFICVLLGWAAQVVYFFRLTTLLPADLDETHSLSKVKHSQSKSNNGLMFGNNIGGSSNTNRIDIYAMVVSDDRGTVGKACWMIENILKIDKDPRRRIALFGLDKHRSLKHSRGEGGGKFKSDEKLIKDIEKYFNQSACEKPISQVMKQQRLLVEALPLFPVSMRARTNTWTMSFNKLSLFGMDPYKRILSRERKKREQSGLKRMSNSNSTTSKSSASSLSLIEMNAAMKKNNHKQTTDNDNAASLSVLFVDNDLLIRRDISELFELPSLGMIWHTTRQWLSSPFLNAGVMLIRPNQALFDRLVSKAELIKDKPESIPHLAERMKQANLPQLTVQLFLGYALDDYRDHVYHLSYTYNLVLTDCLQINSEMMDNVKVVHSTAGPKFWFEKKKWEDWITQNRKVHRGRKRSQYQCVDDYVKEWHQMHPDAHSSGS